MCSYNLLISCPRGKEARAMAEAHYLMDDVGDSSATFWKTSYSGLIKGRTSLNPVDVVAALRTLALDSPWKFRYVLKVVPVQLVVPATSEGIREAAGWAAQNVGGCSSYRITLRCRTCNLPTKEILDGLASAIDVPVNLTNPTCVVLVEHVEGELALCALRQPLFSLGRTMACQEALVKVRNRWMYIPICCAIFFSLAILSGVDG